MVIKSKKKPEMNQIATAQNDITLNYIGKVLFNPDPILSGEARQQGIKIFEDMLYEARVASEMQKRKLAVIGKEWDIIPASDEPQDQEIADFVKKVFENFSHDRGRQALLAGIVTGFKPGEIMWDYSEGDIWIKEIKGVSPKRFVFDLEGNLRLLTWKDMIQGEEIPDRKFIIFTNPSDNGSPYGDGIGRSLYWPIWFKKNGVKFWAVFLDKFGQPTPWGKYPPGTKEDDQNKLLDSLKAMQTDQAIITPDNMAVELLEAARASSVDSYERWEKFWNDAISFIILGQTATTEGTPGKLGSEEARSDVRDDIVKADADLLCECENEQLIKWLVDYNFAALAGSSRSLRYPKIWIRTELEKDLKPLAERDRILIKEIGLPTTVSYVRDTYGIPEPEEGEELISVPQSAPAPFGFAEVHEGRRTRGVKRQTSQKTLVHRSFAEQDWVSRYMESLTPSLKNLKADALAKIEAYLRSQSSPPSEEEFISRIQGVLGDAYKNIDKVAVVDAVTGIYQAFKGIDVAVGFGGADIRAINFLGKLDHFYLSKFIENPDAQAATMDFLKTRYLSGGEGLFGRGDPGAIADLKNLLSQHMTDLEGYQVRRIVETSVVRERNWAHVNQLHEGAVEELIIVEPTQECALCQRMDGQVINVDVAYNRMRKMADMDADEFEEALKGINERLRFDASGRLTDESIAAIAGSGDLPPYHPYCHGRIVRV